MAELNECIDALTRVTGLLLQGIRHHAVVTSPSLHEDFMKAMGEHEQNMAAAGADGKALIPIVGAIQQSMHNYARASEATIEASRHELQTIVVMLTRTLTRILHGSEATISNLQSFERRIEGARQVDDIRSVKRELEACLKALHSEVQRYSEEKAQLQQAVRSATQHPSVVASFSEVGEDPLTGLGSAGVARTRMRDAIDRQDELYIIPLRVDNLPIINARYGRDSGDSFLVQTSQLLVQLLGRDDELYRWGGPCLLATLPGRTSPEAVRGEMDRLTSRARDHAVTLNGRSVIFKMGVSFLVIRTLQYPDLESLIAQIDAFAFKEHR